VTSVIKQAKVVLATCHGAGGRQLHGRTFDVVIIDEATQAIEAASVSILFRVTKLTESCRFLGFLSSRETNWFSQATTVSYLRL